jgi:hypothetical protein
VASVDCYNTAARGMGSNNSNHLNDGTEADAMAESRERTGGSLSTESRATGPHPSDPCSGMRAQLL